MLVALLTVVLSEPALLAGSFDGSLQAYAAKISEGEAVLYSVEASLQDEPILIRSPNLALDSPRVRALVAEAVQGEWVETRPNRLRLEIGRATVAKLEDRDFQEEHRTLADWLEKLKRDHRTTDKEQVAKLLEEVASFDRRSRDGAFVRAGISSYEAPTPARELLIALLLDLGPKTLAKVPLGDTRTWSNTPAGTQERLPAASMSALKTFQSASDKLASTLAKEDMPNDPYRWAPLFDNLLKDRSSCKVLLTVLPYFVRSYRLRVYDRNDELVDTAMAMVPRGSPSTRPPLESGLVPSKQIPLSDSSREFMELYTEGELYMTDLSRRRPPPQAMLLKQLDFEPLSVGFGELFAELAARSSKTCVAYLPDVALDAALDASKNGAVDGTVLWNQLATRGQVEVSSTQDSLVVQPANPIKARHDRVGRVGLHRYAGEVLRRQGITPRIVCVFYFEGGPGALMSRVSSAFNRCLYPLVPLRSMFVRHWPGTLLGGMGDTLWHDLEAGRGISVRNLSDSQKRDFRRWLEFGGPGPYRYEPSVTAGNAILDYQLFVDLAEDPVMISTTRGSGQWAGAPPFPTRLSAMAEQLAANKIGPESISNYLGDRYDVMASTSYTAVARLGYVEWASESLGDDTTQQRIVVDTAFKDWPETLRTRLLRAVRGVGRASRTARNP